MSSLYLTPYRCASTLHESLDAGVERGGGGGANVSCQLKFCPFVSFQLNFGPFDIC